MKLTIREYKSVFDETSIRIEGLTVLSGANSSGKSSFMQPFLLLKQTVESNFDTGTILLDGANARISDSTEALSNVGNKKSRKFLVKYEEGNKSSSIEFRRNLKAGLVVDNVRLVDENVPNGLTLRNRMTHAEIASQLSDQKTPFRKLFEDKSFTGQWKVVRNKCFLDIEFKAEDKKIFPLRLGVSPAAPIQQFVQMLIHIPGLRGNPERSYRIADSGVFFPGSFEPYVASIISKWRSDPKKAANSKKLSEDLQILGLASAIDTKRLSDTRIEVRVSKYLGCSDADKVNIADVGFGVSQALPILVALLTAKNKHVVYIEQPELHLHPRAQHGLAKIIARAVNAGVKVIIETHSSILLRGIQTSVAKGLLKREAVSLYWFKQDPSSGRSLVSHAELDEQGAFGDWPSDFDEVSLVADDEYLNAVEESIYAKAKN